MTKLSSNPKYGWPSGAKQRRRNHAWQAWSRGMTLLRSIHEEPAFAEKRATLYHTPLESIEAMRK